MQLSFSEWYLRKKFSAYLQDFLTEYRDKLIVSVALGGDSETKCDIKLNLNDRAS